MADHNFRMNRAVGIMNKGDEFTSDPTDRKIMSLLGAGYVDDLGEVDGHGNEVRGEPTEHAADTSPDHAAIRAQDGQHDRGGGEEDGPA
jgi:hypothetical protein